MSPNLQRCSFNVGSNYYQHGKHQIRLMITVITVHPKTLEWIIYSQEIYPSWNKCYCTVNRLFLPLLLCSGLLKTLLCFTSHLQFCVHSPHYCIPMEYTGIWHADTKDSGSVPHQLPLSAVRSLTLCLTASPRLSLSYLVSCARPATGNGPTGCHVLRFHFVLISCLMFEVRETCVLLETSASGEKKAEVGTVPWHLVSFIW